MPRRWVRIIAIVVAVAVALGIVGYLLFNLDGETPGSGTGETITEPSR
jgi:hypothetical protein